MPASSAPAADTSSNRLSTDVARTYQQVRLRLLALEQKSTTKKTRKGKSGGFFSSIKYACNSARGRNGNISSLNGLFGRRKGHRRYVAACYSTIL